MRNGLGKLDAHDAPAFLHEVILFLVLAGVLIPLLQRLSINPVLGFLAGGLAPIPCAASRSAAASSAAAGSAQRRPERERGVAVADTVARGAFP